MKLIEQLSERIEEEIQDAAFYAKMAVEYKENHPGLAEALIGISQDEMGHMSTLHDEVVRIIEKYRKEHGDPPADMLAIYNYLHNKHIEKAKDAKMLQAMYKEK